jgi:hypothetical protein
VTQSHWISIHAQKGDHGVGGDGGSSGGERRPASGVDPKQAASGAEAKKVTPGTKLEPRWCPPGLTKMQHCNVQKLRAKEIKEEKREAVRDQWFNQELPMMKPAKTWKEKWIEKEDRDGEYANESKGNEAGQMDVEINMVFHLPAEFELPEQEVARLDLGAKRDVFEKPEEVRGHMKPLYIKGHLDGMLVDRMLVDGGACVNIMPCALFQKLGHKEDELMRTNMTLSGFSGKVSEAKGIILKELMVGSKIVPTTFFVVDVKVRYNVLLGRDWIHANGCVPSMLHQCVIQWVGDEVEVIHADDTACIAVVDAGDGW